MGDSDDDSETTENAYIITNDGDETVEGREMDVIREQRVLTELFEQPARRKLIEWLLDKWEQGDTASYTKADIYDQSGVSRRSQVKHMPVLEAYGLVRTEGTNHTRYSIPHDSDNMLAHLAEMQRFVGDNVDVEEVEQRIND
jgi:uncharacterized protein involved in propanediol utilization